MSFTNAGPSIQSTSAELTQAASIAAAAASDGDLLSDSNAVASTSGTSNSFSAPPLLGHSHPISLKLRSILTKPISKHEEEVTREGLRALEEMYASRSNGHSSQRRRKRGSKKARHQDNEFDVVFARTHFETDAQEALLRAGQDYIQVLEKVDGALGQVEFLIDSMGAACDDVDKQLSMANDATRYLLEQAEGLQRQQATTESQRALLDLFLTRFTLTQEEQDVIHRRDVPVGSRLFTSMDRIAQIRRDCRALLEGGGEAGGGRRAGTDIMASMSAHQDVAHEKLAKYLNFHFRQAPKEGVDVSRTLRESVRRLAEGNREDLLRPALQLLASIRSSFLAATFQQALSQGTSGSRPIELHAHDPMRYVGDMFAWVHQAVAGEREFLGQLFGELEGEGGRRVGERRRGIEGSIDWSKGAEDGSMVPSRTTSFMRETLDKSLDGCCRPLQLRVEQTILAQEGPISVFKLIQLAQFYQEIMLNTLGSGAALSRVLLQLNETGQRAFSATMERVGSRLTRAVEAPQQDLAPPASLLGAIATLKELLSAHAASRAEASAVAHSQNSQGSSKTSDEAFNDAVTQLITAMLEVIGKTEQMTAAGGRNVQRNPSQAPAHAAVFRLNCIERILDSLASYDFAASIAEPLRERQEQTKTQLIEADHQELRSQSGLLPLAIDVRGDTSISPEAIQQGLQTFHDSFLTSAADSELILDSRLLSRLSSPRTREALHQSALDLLATDYEGLLARRTEQGGDSTKWRSAAEVRMLLGLSS